MTTPYRTTEVLTLAQFTRVRNNVSHDGFGRRVKPTNDWPSVKILTAEVVGTYFHRSPKVIVYMVTKP